MDVAGFMAAMGRRRASGGGPPAFVPTDIASMIMVLTTQITGSPVSAWADDSVNGNDFAQGTGASQPAAGTVGGRAAPVGDGTDDYMDGPAAEGVLNADAGDFECFLAVQASGASTPGSSNYYDIAAFLTESDGWTAIGPDGTSQVIWGYNDGVSGDVQVTDAVNVLDSAVHVIRFGLERGSLFLQIDGRTEVLVSGVATHRTFTSTLRTLADYALTRYVAGGVHVFFSESVLSVADRVLMYGYLAAQYGATVPASTNSVAPSQSWTIDLGGASSPTVTPGTWSTGSALRYTLTRNGSPVSGLELVYRSEIEAYVATAADVGPGLMTLDEGLIVVETDIASGNAASSNEVVYDDATRLANVAVWAITSEGPAASGVTLADSDTTFDAWEPLWGGLAGSGREATAPASGQRPARGVGAGVGGRDRGEWDDAAGDVLVTPGQTIGSTHGAQCHMLAGYTAAEETIGNHWARYSTGSSVSTVSSTWASTEVSRLLLGGTGAGTTAIGTTALKTVERLLFHDVVANSGGGGDLRAIYVGNALEGSQTDGTSAPRTDGGYFAMGATSAAGSNASAVRGQGYAWGRQASAASTVLDTTRRAELHALMTYLTGVT